MNQSLLQTGRSAIPSEQEAMLAATTGRKLIDTLSRNSEYRFQILQKSLPIQEFAIPDSAMLLLAQILTEMGQGNAVAVTPIEQRRNDLSSEVQSQVSENVGLGTRIAQRFAAIGGVDLDIPARSMARPAPIFTDDVS